MFQTSEGYVYVDYVLPVSYFLYHEESWGFIFQSIIIR